MSFSSKSKSPLKSLPKAEYEVLVLDPEQSILQFPYESFFGKLELGNGGVLNVCFVEFAPLTLNSKELKDWVDFPLGSISIIEGDVNKSTIDEAKEKFTSSSCLNDSLEWNENFIKKIWLSFIKKLKNVKFYYEKSMEEGVVISKTLRLVFIVQD